jgi:class 3 adenylate cyclase
VPVHVEGDGVPAGEVVAAMGEVVRRAGGLVGHRARAAVHVEGDGVGSRSAPYESVKMAVTPESEGLTLHAVLMAEAVESRR